MEKARRVESIKILYVGDFGNHGSRLPTVGTGLVYLLSLLDQIDEIDIVCPSEKNKWEEIPIPNKAKYIHFYNQDNVGSLLSMIKMDLSGYDYIIFNALATGFGDSYLINAVGLFLPVFIGRIYKDKVRLIYHNSTFTNDIKKLGYGSHKYAVLSSILKAMEITIFLNVRTYLTLNMYKNIIDKKLRLNRVNAIRLHYLEAMPTLFLNGLQQTDKLNVTTICRKKEQVRFLLHGYWGPQKDPESALKALKEISDSGVPFTLVFSGGVNKNFPEFQKHYKELVQSYKDIITDAPGRVSERDILNLFACSDALILPYNAPGGYSAVLETAMFFGLFVIIYDFPEYREQVADYDKAIFCTKDNVKSAIMEFLQRWKNENYRREVDIQYKINHAKSEISHLFD